MVFSNNRKSDDIFKMLIVGLSRYGAFLTPGDHQIDIYDAHTSLAGKYDAAPDDLFTERATFSVLLP